MKLPSVIAIVLSFIITIPSVSVAREPYDYTIRPPDRGDEIRRIYENRRKIMLENEQRERQEEFQKRLVDANSSREIVEVMKQFPEHSSHAEKALNFYSKQEKETKIN